MIRALSGGHVVVIGSNDDALDDDDTEEGLGAALMSDVSHQSPMSTSSTPMIVRRKSVVDRQGIWSWNAGTSVRQLCCVSCSADDAIGEEWRDRDPVDDVVDPSQTLDVTDRPDSVSVTSDRRLVATVARATTVEDNLDGAGVELSSVKAVLGDGQSQLHPDVTDVSLPLPCGVAGVGYRLGLRNTLSERRKRIADYSLVCALFGLAIVVAETEMSMADVYDKVSQSSVVKMHIFDRRDQRVHCWYLLRSGVLTDRCNGYGLATLCRLHEHSEQNLIDYTRRHRFHYSTNL